MCPAHTLPSQPEIFMALLPLQTAIVDSNVSNLDGRTQGQGRVLDRHGTTTVVLFGNMWLEV